MKLLKGSIEKRGPRSYRAIIYICGKKKTATFPSQQLAQAWLMDINRGIETLTMEQQREAAIAYSMLPTGTTLTQCVQAYLDALAKTPTTKQDLTSLANAFIGERQKDLRKNTLDNYRRVLNHTLEQFDTLAEITTEAVRTWVNTQTPHNKNRTLRALSAFFSWLIERDYATSNPIANIKLAKVDAPARQVLSIEETKKLLATAIEKDKRLIPYLALCLFAGLRPDECKQLTPAHFTKEYIRIDESIAKTHSARTVPIHNNLSAILAKYPIPSNGIMCGLSHDRFKKNVSALIKASGIEWANDIMRHSYASYEYERTRDAPATAANMGHTGTDLFFRHYRGLVEPKTGEQFFSITL